MFLFRWNVSVLFLRVTVFSCQVLFSSWSRWTGSASMSSLLSMMPCLPDIDFGELWMVVFVVCWLSFCFCSFCIEGRCSMMW